MVQFEIISSHFAEILNYRQENSQLNSLFFEKLKWKYDFLNWPIIINNSGFTLITYIIIISSSNNCCCSSNSNNKLVINITYISEGVLLYLESM